MAKRHHRADSDDESIPRASPKRARTADSDEEAPARNRRRDGNTRDDRRSQKARAPVESDEEEELREEDVATANMDVEMDDEEFEERYGNRLREHLDETRKHITPGGVAEYGIVEYIEMHQFMCHKFLRFTFGPQINFIIGHNGSGKSAVLSAITVALGGKAASTGRGNGLKSFIREGQGAAEVSIHIKNQGEEAFKPDEYGNTIVITRRFTRDGSSSWKIKGKDKPKVVSTKKEELAAICDHMNIQVDNPMNVLTQDSARQFLSASAPSEKYKFFLRGTQLQQLSEDYETCLSNIRDTTRLLAVKKEALPDLKARRDRIATRFKEAEKARDQKKKATDLKKELAWSHVATKKEELQAAFEESARVARRIPKMEADLEKAKTVLKERERVVGELEAELAAIPDVPHLEAKKRELQEQGKANRNKLAGFKRDLKGLDEAMLGLDQQLRECDEKIAETTRIIEDNSNGKQEQIAQQLQKARDAKVQFQTQIEQLIVQRRELGHQLDTLNQEQGPLLAQQRKLQDDIMHIQNDIASAKQSENDALVPYGRNMKKIVEIVKKTRWHGERPPVGPLGVYVKARDPARWGDILRKQLGHLLCSFAVTDARDQNHMKKILSENGNPHLMVINNEVDLFDYSHGEQPEGVHTVLRELEISDEYVLRVLINQASIERIVLAQTREDGDRVLKKLRNEGYGGNVAWANGFVVKVFPEGGGTSMKTGGGGDMRGPQSLLLTGRDTASEISHLTMRKQQKDQELAQCNNQLKDIQTRQADLRRRIDICNRDENRIGHQLRGAKNAETQYQEEASQQLPVDIQFYENNKMTINEEKQNLIEQATFITEQKVAVDLEMQNIQSQINEIRELQADHANRKHAGTRKVEDAGVERQQAVVNVHHWENKLKEDRAELARKEEAANVVEEELKMWTAKAAEYCDEIPNPRKTEVIQRQLDSVTKALKEREKADGATVEQMGEELNKADDIWKRASSDYYSMVKLNKALNNSLLTRLSRWQEFRRHIALRCKQVFQYHLSHRGYYGKILFDHVACTLQLKVEKISSRLFGIPEQFMTFLDQVQTDEQMQTQGASAMEKDPRSLSGGEKSFSTICLLLSLWECIGCPLRCLDEFDVFMDAVNRRISMKMMIDTANNSDKKQYILITPQDMSNVAMGPTVRVHRMIDPERGGGVLPFAS